METPLLSYKPSTFYFRRALRASACRKALANIIASLTAEIELMRDFARGHGLIDRHDSDGTMFELPNSPEEMRTAGLRLCCELEEVKQVIRDHGLIPPKRHIMRSEAMDKGWAMGA
jgi:hypothetical protein